MSEKKFASHADLEEKQISWEKLSDNAYAYTAEGDPNTGVIIGDDGCMIIDATATPVAAQGVIKKIREITDKPIKYVVLTHYHAVRVLGASGYKPEGLEQIIASHDTYDLIVERGQQDMDSEIGRFPRLFQAVESVPGLTWPTEVPASFYTDPLMYQGGSDDFIGPRDAVVANKDWGIDFEAEVTVVTGDVKMGATPAEAAKAIRLVMLVNDVSLRGLIPNELAKGFGFFQSKPASAFSPVAVTPDELDAWRDAKVHLPLVVHLNGQLFGKPNAGVDMTFDFGQLVAHVAKTRNLGAGAIIGSGTVSNKQGNLWGSSIDNGGVGYCCLAEVRTYETIEQGQPQTPFMDHGDTVRIEMFDAAGASIFGTIENRVDTTPFA